MRTITPKNGQYPVVLLAGGPADLAREISQRLTKKLGLVVAHHWDSDKPKQWHRNVPEDVDLTIFLKDFASHAQEELVVRQCASQSVEFIRTQRKWSAMYSALHMVFGMSTASAYAIPKPPEKLAVQPPDAPAPNWTEPPPAPVYKPKPRAPRVKVEVAPPRGGPSEEAMMYISKLMLHASRDGFSVMVTPTEVTISASK